MWAIASPGVPMQQLPLAGVLRDELSRRLRAFDGIGQRHKPGRAEVVREVLQAVCAVVDGLFAGFGQVHDRQHPPVGAVRRGAAGLGGLVADDAPRLLQRGEPAGHRHRQRQQRRAEWACQPGPDGEIIAAVDISGYGRCMGGSGVGLPK